MAEFPALPLWTDAYLGDTTHLTTVEHGAYLLLLITSWRTADCSLPDDDRLLARFARCDARQWKKLRPIIEPFFAVKAGKWRQGRLTDEREAVQRKKEIAAQNGRASALKRKGRHSTERDQGDSEASANGQRNSNLTISNSKPLLSPKNEKPTKRSLAGDWKPEDFADGTEAYAIVAAWPDGELNRQLERFRDYHSAKGNKFANWQSAWGTWVRNSVKFGQDRAPGHSERNFEDIVAEEYERRKRAASGGSR